MSEKKKKKKGVIKKLRNIRRTKILIVLALVMVLMMTLMIIIASIVAATGGYLALFKSDSLSKSFDGSETAGGGRSGGSTGIPQLLPGSRFYMPVNLNKITSVVGIRNSPGGIGSTDHQGIDIGAGGNTVTIYPARPGKVIDVKRLSPAPKYMAAPGGIQLGQYVKLEHTVEGQIMYTIYGHMYQIHVEKGDIVNMDTPLGIVGNTGYSTGPHLHLEIRNSQNKAINPKLLLYCGDTEIVHGLEVSTCFKYRGDIE